MYGFNSLWLSGVIKWHGCGSTLALAWPPQAIIRSSAEFSFVKFNDVHLRAISQRVIELVFCTIRLKYVLLNHCHKCLGPMNWCCTQEQNRQLEYDLVLICYEIHWLLHASVNNVTIGLGNGLAPYMCQLLSTLIQRYDSLNSYWKNVSWIQLSC